MIAKIAAIAEVFFFSAITAMVAIIWKPGFNLTMAYFKRKDCLQRNLYLRASLRKILISSFAHGMDFAHNFSVDFF